MLFNQIIIYLQLKSRYYFLEHICSKIFLHGNTRDKTTAFLAAGVSARQRGQKHRFAMIFWCFFIKGKVHKTSIILPFFVFHTKKGTKKNHRYRSICCIVAKNLFSRDPSRPEMKFFTLKQPLCVGTCGSFTLARHTQIFPQYHANFPDAVVQPQS